MLKTETIQFKVTKEEKERIKANASKQGLTISAYLLLLDRRKLKK